MRKNLLEVRKLVKKYGEFRAVKGISFEVRKKEIFALVGPNGAGKSSTLKTLATILAMTSGKVVLDGFDLVENENEVRERISYLPEEAGAYKNLTGMDYLKFMASLAVNDRSERQKVVQFAVEITALGKRLEDKIKTYSKGMTRKLLLARTIMSKPKLAILDEPTSGMDVINAFEIRKIIRSLADEGISVILSSHNMLEVEFLCDRMAIISEGEIVVSGTPAALKKKYKCQNLEEVFVKAVKIKT